MDPYRTPGAPMPLEIPPPPSDPALAGTAAFREHILAAMQAAAVCEATLDTLDGLEQEKR
jgi:hypothetical protein